jgi:hypothetical protein
MNIILKSFNSEFKLNFFYRLCLVISLTIMSSCNGEKILVANFNGNPLGQPPVHNQEVGVIDNIIPIENSIVAKVPNVPSNWVKITRPNNPQVIAGILGTATTSKGIGKYTFTATLFIPDDGGMATIQFEPFNQTPPNLAYLHIDFLRNNKVRVNDSEVAVFGNFPHNQPFIVQVILTIKSSESTADIVLSGANTSGQFHISNFTGSGFAPRFGCVRLWMGFPWVGTFYATNIVLRYEKLP